MVLTRSFFFNIHLHIVFADSEVLQITAARHETSLFRTNMALAEDRILSFELVSKKDSPWKLLYVASALAEVEVPTYLDELLVQRRRKLNGNTFASLYALAHFTRFLATAHSIPRKIGLTIQFAYQAVSMCLSWFSPVCINT